MIQLHNDDSRRVRLTPGSVDLVVTSPPYKKEDGFSIGLMRDVFRNAHEAMRDEALCFVNFGHLAHQKTRPFDLAMRMQDDWMGELQETFVWVKNHYKPIQGKRRVNNLYEYIFMFSKGKMPEIDRLAVGIPYADKSNVGRYAASDLKCAGNVWYIDYETITSSDQKPHHDRFPLDLPLHCIKLSGIERGSTVLDPFMGSGTTGIAARQLGMNFVGIERDGRHFENAKTRIEEWTIPS